MVPRVIRKMATAILVAWLFGVQGEESLGLTDKKVRPVDRQTREQDFAEKLSPAIFVGHFSIDGQAVSRPQVERYEISSVQRVQQDDWLFVARIKYGKINIKLPLKLKVLWAGVTPVITVDELTIPGLGTFTARVMIQGDRYVGTWQHGQTGGHMWGQVEKGKATATPSGDEVID